MTADTETPASACEARRDDASEARFIPLARIHVRTSHRRPDKLKVRALAGSIMEIGLKEPISLVERERGDGDKRTLYDLVAGAHRLAAYRHLERAEIPAIIMCEADPLRLELWGIDENLMRSELSPGQRAQALARRKEIYLKLHPDTKVGHAQAAGMRRKRKGDVGGKSTPTFVKATAAASGMSESSIEKTTRVGERVAKDVFTMLNGTRFDKTVEWRSLERLTHDQQLHVAKIALASDMATLREIVAREFPSKKRKASPKPSQPPATLPPASTAAREVEITRADHTPGTAREEITIAVAPAEPLMETRHVTLQVEHPVPETRHVTVSPPTISPTAESAVPAGPEPDRDGGVRILGARLCQAWTDSLVLDRERFLRMLGLTPAACVLLAERKIVVGCETDVDLAVRSISLVIEEKKPITIDGVASADPEPSDGGRYE